MSWRKGANKELKKKDLYILTTRTKLVEQLERANTSILAMNLGSE